MAAYESNHLCDDTPQMNRWLQQLAPRERLLVLTAGVLVVIALIIVIGIRPVVNGKVLAERRIDQKLEMLQDLERVGGRFGPVSGTAATLATGATQSLVVLVDRTTRSHGLGAYLKRNQPDGASKIRLRFENVPFDGMVAWLAQLQSEFALITVSASIDTAQETGRVNCNLVLAR